MKWITDQDGVKWATDDKGNRCSVSHFGSEDAAESALASLYGCSNCSNCSGCLRCTLCSNCSNCSDCSRCTLCTRCSDCSGCLRCSGCSNCSDCSNCSNCSHCSDCSNYSNCSDCSHNVHGKPIAIPKIDDIHRRVYEAASIPPEALKMCAWHTCETTHCRAGWVVFLAGDAGKQLESFFNTELAAMLIYKESGYDINPARFYDSNVNALADMKRLAEQ